MGAQHRMKSLAGLLVFSVLIPFIMYLSATRRLSFQSKPINVDEDGYGISFYNHTTVQPYKGTTTQPYNHTKEDTTIQAKEMNQ